MCDVVPIESEGGGGPGRSGFFVGGGTEQTFSISHVFGFPLSFHIDSYDTCSVL